MTNEELKQVQFERTTLSLCTDAKEIIELDNMCNLTVGPVELASISIAVKRLNSFLMRHEKKEAA